MTQDEVQQAREALRSRPSESPKFRLGSLLSPLEALDNVLWRLVDAVKVKAEAINRRTAGDALGTNAAASASHSAAFHGTWYVYIDQVVCGPYNGSEIRNFFVDGRINQQTQVVRVGVENWTKASDDHALHNFLVPTKDALSKITLDTSSDTEEPIVIDAVRAALKSQTEQPQTLAQVKSKPKKRTISTKSLIFTVMALVCFVFAPFILYLGVDEKVDGVIWTTSILIIITGILVFSTVAVVKAKDWMNARGLKVGFGTLFLAWIAFKFVPGAFVAPPSQPTYEAEVPAPKTTALLPGSLSAHPPMIADHGNRPMFGYARSGLRVTTLDAVWVCELPTELDEAWAMLSAHESNAKVRIETGCMELAAGNDGISIDTIGDDKMRVLLKAPYDGIKVWTKPYFWAEITN